MNKKQKLNSAEKNEIFKNEKKYNFISSYVAMLDESILETHVPKSDHLSVNEIINIFKRVERELNHLTTEHAALFIPRDQVMSLVMTLGVFKEKNLNKEFDDDYYAAVKDKEKMVSVASREVQEILNKLTEKISTYEKFREEINKTTDPMTSDFVLNRLSTFPITVQASSGPVRLQMPPDVPKDLPSERAYRLKIIPIIGFDDSTGTATVRLVEKRDDSLNLLSIKCEYKLSLSAREHRSMFIIAQRDGKTIEIDVSIPRISIFPKFPIHPQLKLVNVIGIEES
jgi:hypothetical protein